jgi:hypothetical protein
MGIVFPPEIGHTRKKIRLHFTHDTEGANHPSVDVE